ncbi:nitroreductase [Staphylothermus marinus F1]|uniref:Nitroreductase n=1 Tax=Staphylothermus marinus (strain ATCC 43588 / DSM 3639 / JCM 9404 / F1) TaxID=399550 RepID=A3DKJ0_STAMF|nr:SagB/ThcOx family dehydrogenase [Staphylothermus marinus]ABN69150.1 nitroreductase [Staphylothermus marinus F1]
MPKPKIKLPEPSFETCLLKIISERKSHRKYRKEPLALNELSTVLWSSYGCIDEDCRRRTVPSAGATYPMEIFVFVRENGVIGLEPGIYYYDPLTHSIILIRSGDQNRKLYYACLNQKWVLEAPINIVITAVYERTTSWYGRRGFRYIYMEAGHIGQNIYLAATNLGLGTVAVGAFNDEQIKTIIGLNNKYLVLYVFPIGKI